MPESVWSVIILQTQPLPLMIPKDLNNELERGLSLILSTIYCTQHEVEPGKLQEYCVS